MQASNRWASLELDGECLKDRNFGDGSLYNRDVMDFRFSNCGRYGFLIRERPVDPSRNQPTHSYELFFSVMDTFSRTLKHYKPVTPIFKTYHRFYLLSHNTGVLLDFSRHKAIVDQHLIHFDHLNAEVRCTFSRHWHFMVDEMLAGTDGTYVPGTSQLLQRGSETFVPLLGQIDNFIGYVIMRIIPADPRCQRASSLSVANRVFIFNPNLIVASPNVRKKHFQSAEGISPNGGDDLTSRNDETGGEGDRRSLSTTADYPFIFGFSLFFLVNRTIVPLFNGFDLEAHSSLSINYVLEIDVERLLQAKNECLNAVIPLRRHRPEEIVGLNAMVSTGDIRSHDDALSTETSLTEMPDGVRSIFKELRYEKFDCKHECVSLNALDAGGSELPADCVVDMYTYIQAGPHIYVRLQYRTAQTLYKSTKSRWIDLDLRTQRWQSFFRQPCRARIPFWFCGIPDGRAFFYRQVWKRGTRQVAVRQFRVFMPPREVLPLRKLTFFKFGMHVTGGATPRGSEKTSAVAARDCWPSTFLNDVAKLLQMFRPLDSYF